MQELKVLRWCDHCHSEGGALVEATEKYVITIELPGGRNAQPRTLDLCDTHGKPVRELRDLVTKAGAVLPPKGETSKVEQPEPRIASRLPDNFPRVVAKTVSRVEPKSAEPEDDRRACPVCGKSVRRVTLNGHLHAVHGARSVKQPKKCPDCGKRVELERIMAVHRGAIHGYDYIAEMAATVKRGPRGQSDT